MFLKFIANYMVILPFELSYSFQAYEVSSYENLFILHVDSTTWDLVILLGFVNNGSLGIFLN